MMSSLVIVILISNLIYHQVLLITTPTHYIYPLPQGLDGAAFQSRLPANKLTKQEMDFFPDIASGSQSAIMEFLFIRNKLLQAWLQDPLNELTPEKGQAVVHLPHPGICPL